MDPQPTPLGHRPDRESPRKVSGFHGEQSPTTVSQSFRNDARFDIERYNAQSIDNQPFCTWGVPLWVKIQNAMRSNDFAGANIIDDIDRKTYKDRCELLKDEWTSRFSRIYVERVPDRIC